MIYRRVGDTVISPIKLNVWTRTETPYSLTLDRYTYDNYGCTVGDFMRRNGHRKMLKIQWFYRTIVIRSGRG